MASIAEVEGIGPTYAAKLGERGITTTEALLRARSGQRQGPGRFGSRHGISEKVVLAWTNKADLFRIKDVGEQYTDLLEAAGVDTLWSSERLADNLTQKMTEVNEEKKLVRKLLHGSSGGWMDNEAAKALPRVMTY